MSDLFADIEEFHEKFGLKYDGKPRALTPELFKFRLGFLKEETAEYDNAHRELQYTLVTSTDDHAEITYHMEKALDGLVDLVYVALGTAYLHGFDFRAAWNRVHEANMKKQRASNAEESKRGTSMDVIKPPGWEPPVLTDLVENHAYRLLDQ